MLYSCQRATFDLGFSVGEPLSLFLMRVGEVSGDPLLLQFGWVGFQFRGKKCLVRTNGKSERNFFSHEKKCRGLEGQVVM